MNWLSFVFFLLYWDNGNGCCSSTPLHLSETVFLTRPIFLFSRLPIGFKRMYVVISMWWLPLATSALGWLAYARERWGETCIHSVVRWQCLPYEMWFHDVWQKHRLIRMSLIASVLVYCVVKRVDTVKPCGHYTWPQDLHSQTLCCPCRMCSCVPYNLHNKMK